jgi:hypothetical protein
MSRELRYCVARSPGRFDIEFFPAGLHERPEKLNALLKEAVEKIDPVIYEYVLLNYGLCGNGTLGISHPKLPIVVHNCHDCIPLIVGNKERHKKWVGEKPGTYFYSCGWIDELLVPGCPDYDEKYLELYGRTIDRHKRDRIERILIANYTHVVYIYWNELGPEIAEKGRKYTKQCRSLLAERFGLHLAYDEIEGIPALIRSFVEGGWDENCVIIVEPGKELAFNASSGMIFAK